MFTKVKTAQEIDHMRTAGKMLATILQLLADKAEPGMTGRDANHLAARELKALGGKPSFLGQYGFPDVICISVNDAVVHGIPNATPFKKGDLVSFDFGVTIGDMITDAATSIVVGSKAGDTSGRQGNSAAARLLRATERSLYAGIEQLHGGVRVGDIAVAVEAVLQAENLGIVRDLVGHGVGHQLHEDPNIPNYGTRGTGPSLKTGMTIAIEPMATLGGESIFIDDDEWTIRTKDGSLAAHFEHTILITQDGYEILTQL